MKIYQNLKKFLEQRGWWKIFTYLFFGGLATLVNVISYMISFNIGLNWQISNTISWICSVLFAFITNKLWVFHSKTNNLKDLLLEFIKFIIARIISYGLDMFFMYLLIDGIKTNDLFAKIITQVIVVIMNYFFSKFFIFKISNN